MNEKEIKETVENLSKLEWECWEFITTSGTVTLEELKKVNPKFIGAIGKLITKKLVKRERLPNLTLFHPTIDTWE
jgi:hypothetical protein